MILSKWMFWQLWEAIEARGECQYSIFQLNETGVAGLMKFAMLIYIWVVGGLKRYLENVIRL